MKRQLLGTLKCILVFIFLAGIRSYTFAVVTDSATTGPVDLWHSDFNPSSIKIAPTNTLAIFSRLVNSELGNYSGSGSTAYYLSQDSVLTISTDSSVTGDILLGKTYFYNFPGSSSYSDSIFIYSFPNVPVGQYYIICYTDDENLVVESNEANNYSYIPVTVMEPTMDIYPSDLILPDSVASYSSVYLNYRINNGGSATALNFREAYFISSDTILDSEDTFITAVDAFAEPGYSIQRYFSINIPGIPNGDYYFIVSSDSTNIISETNENNNIIAKPIRIAAPSIDLIAKGNFSTSLAPASIAPGNNFELYFYSDNAGTIPVSYYNSNVYLSKDSIYDESDLFLAQTSVYNVDQQRIYRENASVSIPDSIVPGTYYFIVRMDANNSITETNEDNNIAIGQTEIVPVNLDIEVRAVNAETIVFKGQYNNLLFNLANWGSTYGKTSINYYLSSDSIVDGSDLFLSSETYYLTPNSSYFIGFSSFFSGSIADGEYYVIAVADETNSISEANENNNIGKVKVTIQPATFDITHSFASVSDSVVIPGTSYTITYTVNNLGNSPLYDNVYSFAYLSTDSIYSSDDINIFSSSCTLYGNSSLTIPIQRDMPLDVPPGQYYILILGDQYNYVAEINEDNNNIIIPITVGSLNADLSIRNVTLEQSTKYPGSSVIGHATLLNKGTSSLSAYIRTAFYISIDSKYDETDRWVGETYFNGVGANDSNQTYFNFYIPSDFSAGKYYLISKADPDNIIFEANEEDNQLVTTIQVEVPKVDLKVKSANIPSSIYVGSAFSVSSYIHNRGVDASNYTITGYYISSDTILDYNDNLIYSSPTAPISGKDSIYQSDILNLPYFLPSGVYYLFIVADDYNYQPETREDNNTLYRKIRVKDVEVDITINKPSLSPKNVLPGDVVKVKETIVNKSSQLVYSGYTEYFLSTDTIYSNDDRALFGSGYIYNLSPQSERIDSSVITIPNDIATGKYYIIYHVDAYNYYYENDEANNYTYRSINIVSKRSAKESSDEEMVSSNEIYVNVIPNPVQESINVVVSNGSDKKVAFKLLNLLGNEINSGTINVNYGNFSIPASDLKEGVYLLQIEVDGINRIIRVIKQ